MSIVDELTYQRLLTSTGHVYKENGDEEHRIEENE